MKVPVDSRSCVLQRWQAIKATLNNLNYEEFINKSTAENNSILLDVRTSEEFNTGTIANSRNINYLSQNLADDLLQLESAKTYFVFCRTGRRSLRVCALMKNIGHEVYNLDGGLAGKELSV